MQEQKIHIQKQQVWQLLVDHEEYAPSVELGEDRGLLQVGVGHSPCSQAAGLDQQTRKQRVPLAS